MRHSHLLAQLKSMLLLGTTATLLSIHAAVSTRCCLASPTWNSEVGWCWEVCVQIWSFFKFLKPSDSRFSFPPNYTFFQLHLSTLSLCDRPHHNITPSVSAVGYYLHATINITVRNYNPYQYFTEVREWRQWKEIKFQNYNEKSFPLMTPAFYTVCLYAWDNVT